MADLKIIDTFGNGVYYGVDEKGTLHKIFIISEEDMQDVIETLRFGSAAEKEIEIRKFEKLFTEQQRKYATDEANFDARLKKV